MSANYEDFKQGNAQFVTTFTDGDKPLPPARKALLLTCMDGESGTAGRTPSASQGALGTPPAGTTCRWHAAAVPLAIAAPPASRLSVSLTLCTPWNHINPI